MVLILLSTPNHNTPIWPSTPRSMDMPPLSPRTPLTPSPSFFAILSPIFTADDNVPASPALLQMSPGMIPPETPPPWLLGPHSPATTIRPVPSRTSSVHDFSTPSTTENVGQVPYPRRRPAFPSTTYSFTAGHAQAFRPPPPLALKRMRTAPIPHGPSSPLRQALNATSHTLPELTLRPPSRETLERSDPTSNATFHDSSSEILTIGMTGLDLQPMSPDCETMEIPIALEAPPPTPDTGRTITQASHNATSIRAMPRPIQQLRHARSPSAPVVSRSERSSFSLKSKSQAAIPQLPKPLELTEPKTHRYSMSVANLKQFDKETGGYRIETRYEIRC